jgi:hypothetical protein
MMGALIKLLYICLFVYSCYSDKRKKWLIISVDNREMNPSFEAAQYLSMTSVLNQEYANYHGYDFINVQDVIKNLEEEVKSKYSQYDEIPPTTLTKDMATAFHVGLHQFRAASWAKLPGIWHIVDTLGKNYERIFYIDSDAVISPLHMNRSLDDAMNSWVNNTIRGNQNPWQSNFIFFYNHPWRDDMPCAGTFIFKVKEGEPTLREWWDFNLSSKNFYHFHEQDALWHMISNPSYNFKMSDQTITIVNEKQFPSPWIRYEDLWLCHISAYNYMLRSPILYHFLVHIGVNSNEIFKEKLSKIKSVKVNMLNVTEKMEQISSQDPNRITRFPLHDLATQRQW